MDVIARRDVFDPCETRIPQVPRQHNMTNNAISP
jgi:hypothetical protein